MISTFLNVFSSLILSMNSFWILFAIMALAQIVAIDDSAIRSVMVIYRKRDSTDSLNSTEKSCRAVSPA